MNKWRPIKTAKKILLRETDLWLIVPARARSMGMGDSFRVPNAYWLDEQPKAYRNPERRDDWHAGWFHCDRMRHRRLDDSYITLRASASGSGWRLRYGIQVENPVDALITTVNVSRDKQLVEAHADLARALKEGARLARHNFEAMMKFNEGAE